MELSHLHVNTRVKNHSKPSFPAFHSRLTWFQLSISNAFFSQSYHFFFLPFTYSPSNSSWRRKKRNGEQRRGEIFPLSPVYISWCITLCFPYIRMQFLPLAFLLFKIFWKVLEWITLHISKHCSSSHAYYHTTIKGLHSIFDWLSGNFKIH